MKQVIILLAAIIVTSTSFATVKPTPFVITPEIKALFINASSLELSLKSAGKINLTWNAGLETTTTIYTIQKSINGSAFKTVAILMGESNESYSFRDSVKDINGDVVYRVVMVNNDKEICTLSQNLVIL